MIFEPLGTCEKSTTMSALSAGQRKRACSFTFQTVILLLSISYHTGVFLRSTGYGKKPHSVHICIISGQTVAGSGNHQSLESGDAHQAGQFHGTAGTIFTSSFQIHAMATAHVQVVSVIVTVGAVVYHDHVSDIHMLVTDQATTVAYQVAWLHHAGGAEKVTVGLDEYPLHQFVTATVRGVA